MHHAQAQQLFAWRAALVEHLEQHHVPPGQQKGDDGTQAHAQLAEQGKGDKQQAQQQAANGQVDGKRQRARQQAGGAQNQVDAFRGFHFIAGVQQLAWRRAGLESGGGGCGGHRQTASDKPRC